MKKFVFPVLLLTLALSGCDLSLAGDIKPPADYTPPAALPPAATAVAFPLVPPDPANGEKVYVEFCLPCHGDAGNGAGRNAGNTTTSPTALSQADLINNAIPQSWFEVISKGSVNGSMPGFESKLDDRSRWDSISYLFSLKNTHEQMAAGAEIFISVCSQCHGENGQGNGPEASTVRVPPADFTDQSVMAAISNQDMVNVLVNGLGDSMPAFGNMLSDDKRWAVTNYIRSLSFKPGEQTILPAGSATLVPTASSTLDAERTPSVVIDGVVTDTPVLRVVDVTGKVTNDSGTPLPAGLKVTLQIFDNMLPSDTLETVINADGSYVFTNLETPTGRIYITLVEYNGQQFASQPSTIPGVAEDTSLKVIDLPIHFYESTTDKSVAKADRLHIFLDFTNPGFVQVVELYLISNTSDKVLVSDDPGAGILEFSVPEGAQTLQFQDSIMGERYLQTEKGFADTIPVKPGVSTGQVLFAFDLPYTKKMQLSLPISINVDSVSAMIPIEGIKLKSDQLVDGGTRTNQGMNFRLFTGENLKAGSTLDLTISGTTASSTTTTSKVKINPALFGAGVLLLAISGVGLYFYQKQKVIKKGAEEATDANPGDKESIIDAIIALDNLHKEGKLQDDIYTARREELKTRLKSLM